MADITHLFLRRHLRSGPTEWTRHSAGGRVRHEGVGLSYSFRARTAVISEVPVEDRELSLVAHARTADQAEVSVPLGLTWRVVEPGLAARRLDFGIDTRTGRFRSTPLDALATLLGELAQEPVLALLAGTALEAALATGPEPVRRAVATRLAGDERLAELGVAVVGVRVLAVRAAPDLERALQTPTREAAQARADEATYRRRADAVERERVIAENELQSSIELARREEQLVEQRGANARRQAELSAAAETVATEAEAARTRTAAAADAEKLRLAGAAEADRARAAAEVEAERARALAVAEAERLAVVGAAEADRARVLAGADAEQVRLAAAAEADRVREVGAAELERDRAAAEVEAARLRQVGVAGVAGEAARVAALRDVPVEVLGALALRELAARLPEIGQLTITPDVLPGLVTRLAVNQAR
jgi:hypothetical protein